MTMIVLFLAEPLKDSNNLLPLLCSLEPSLYYDGLYLYVYQKLKELGKMIRGL